MTAYTPRNIRKGYPLEVFARRPHYIDHIAPIWKLLPDDKIGNFYVPPAMEEYATQKGIPNVTAVRRVPATLNPMLVCAYDDLRIALESCDSRGVIMSEHGVGLAFTINGIMHAGYAGGAGLRAYASHFLSPNMHCDVRTRTTFPNAPTTIIGTPKLDWIPAYVAMEKDEDFPRRNAIVWSWHHDGSSLCPEAGNCWDFYKHILPEVYQRYSIYAHAHPRLIQTVTPFLNKLGIPIIENFDDVLMSALLYIMDGSSTLYEFAATGNPVVILNKPEYRRNVEHGLRFWKYSDIGVVCNHPKELIDCIGEALHDTDEFRLKREACTRDLYPYMGHSAQVAADAVLEVIG